MKLEAGVDVGGFKSDVFRWIDASGPERRATMVRNDITDPTNHHGGFLRELSGNLKGKVALEFGQR